jgi:lysophospholipid acyltransferase (LPLAT)-like uncharacterized protein
LKIRNPRVIRFLARIMSLVVRCWMGTQKFAYAYLGPDPAPTNPRLKGRYIYAFWHENLLFPLFFYRGLGIHVLVSQHADGELIAEVMRCLGFELVRGSSTRGGVEAVRQLVRIAKHSHLSVTPDGPRGPRREVQMGLIYLAARTGMPIVPAGIGYDRPWRFGSWDRFAVPRPWGRARCIAGEPILVPARAGREELEVYRRHVEAVFADLSSQAERWAEGGSAPTAAGLRRSA